MDTLNILAEYKEKMSLAIGIIAEGYAYAPFGEFFKKNNLAYKKFNPDKSEHTREEYHQFFEAILEASNFGNIQSQILTNSEEIADLIITTYVESIDILFEDKKLLNMKIKYQLNADQKAIQLSKISSIITSNFNTVVTYSREVETQRNWLESNYLKFKYATDDELDLGTIARNFGIGALAVAKPWIGIPAFIANWKTQSDQQKSMETMVENWFNKFCEFEEKIADCTKNIIDAAEKTKSYVTERSKEVNGDAIIDVCTGLKNLRQDIGHFNKYLLELIAEANSIIEDHKQGA